MASFWNFWKLKLYLYNVYLSQKFIMSQFTHWKNVQAMSLLIFEISNRAM